MLTLLKWPWEFIATCLLWLYFTLGFCLFWMPLFVFQALAKRPGAAKAQAFQRLIHLYFRSFFCLVRLLCPGLRITKDLDLASLGGCILVANHRSYLDPILLNSLFARHGTVVRRGFFRVPFFGWVLRTAGYLASGKDLEALSRGLALLPEFVAQGGVFFIFPEGTRKRDSDPRPGPFKKGAFGIAARHQLPLALLAIQGTDRLFPPGRFLFRAADRVHIHLKLVQGPETLDPSSAADHRELAGKAQKRIGDACDP